MCSHYFYMGTCTSYFVYIYSNPTSIAYH